MATQPERTPPERRLSAVALLAQAAGVHGMVAGQVVDLESEGRDVGPDVLEYVHRHKTGALLGAAAEIGGVMGGGGSEDTRRLGQFGREVGLAFQIVDDILDVEGEAETLGKSAGKDARSGKLTYPKLHGIEEARTRAREHMDKAVSLTEPLGAPAEPLVRLAYRIVERQS